MNDTPTPRMTEAWSKTSRTADGMYSSTPCHIDIAANCYKEGCVIERELTAAREEVEIYKRDNKQLRKDVVRIGSTLKDFKEQRDRLAAALQQIASSDPNWRDCLLIAREALATVKGGSDEV